MTKQKRRKRSRSGWCLAITIGIFTGGLFSGQLIITRGESVSNTILSDSIPITDSIALDSSLVEFLPDLSDEEKQWRAKKNTDTSLSFIEAQPALPVVVPRRYSSGREVIRAYADRNYSSQWGYLEYHVDFAIEQMRKYGIPASVTLSQGLFESGVGYSYISMRGNNYFGIKHSERLCVEVATTGAINGFSSFATVRDCYEYRSQMLTNCHYADHIRGDSVDDWLRVLDNGGNKDMRWCPEKGYTKKIRMIIDRHRLWRIDEYVRKGW